MGDLMQLFGLSAAWLAWSTAFSVVGLGYFFYGRRHKQPLFKWSGVALLVYPIAVSDTYFLVGAGILLSALPFILRPKG